MVEVMPWALSGYNATLGPHHYWPFGATTLLQTSLGTSALLLPDSDSQADL